MNLDPANLTPQIKAALTVLEHLAQTPPDTARTLWPTLDPTELDTAIKTITAVMQHAAKNSDTPAPDNFNAAIADLDLHKILVVDDLKDNRFLIEYMFRNSEFSLSMASSAPEALAKARAEHPILIISDIQMPEMSGFDLLAAIKADEQTRHSAFIFVTAHHRTSKQVVEGLRMGADDYIYRPYVRDEFMSRVEAVVRAKRAQVASHRQARTLALRNKGLAWVNDLALAVNSSHSLTQIFSSSLHKLLELLNAQAAALLLFDADAPELVINIAAAAGAYLEATVQVDPAHIAGDSSKLESLVDRLTTVIAGHHRELGLPGSINRDMLVAIPLHSKEQFWGAIVILNHLPGPLDEVDQALLNSAASIIAVAVENSRLLATAQQLVDDLIALNEVSRALTSTLDLHQILNQTTTLVQQSLRSEAASLWLLDQSAQELELIAASGVGTQAITGYRLPLQHGIAGYVAQSGQMYLSADVSQDARHFEQVARLTGYNPRSMLCVPVEARGQIIGVMQALHQHVNWFDQNDLRLAYPIASAVGIAIENARLFKEVTDFNQRLEQMVAARTKELAGEKEKIEAILSGMADGLLVIDANNQLVTANAAAAELLGCSPKALTRYPVDPDCLQYPIWANIHRLVQRPEAKIDALFEGNLDQSGQPRAIHAHLARLHAETGQITGAVIVLRDLTAFREVDRLKAQFLTGVTHELKTPLSIIQLHTQNLLAYQNRLPALKKAELLRAIQNQSQILYQLIEDILTLSQLDNNYRSPRAYEPIDTAAIITRLVADLSSLATQKKIELRWLPPAPPVLALADAALFSRAVRNLVDNALKYTPAGGVVTITLGLDHLFVAVSITDTGIGIAAEHQARVFERFYRADPAHAIPGTGLGLAIVQEIVNAYGGSIQIESAPGTGSTFTLKLPAYSAGQSGPQGG